MREAESEQCVPARWGCSRRSNRWAVGETSIDVGRPFANIMSPLSCVNIASLTYMSTFLQKEIKLQIGML